MEKQNNNNFYIIGYIDDYSNTIQIFFKKYKNAVKYLKILKLENKNILGLSKIGFSDFWVENDKKGE